jgi:hypothetical protein
MRWAIGILLVLNLMFFLWQGFIAPEHTARQTLAEPDVGNLRLLSELPPALEEGVGTASTQPLPRPASLEKLQAEPPLEPSPKKPVEPVETALERKPVTVPAPLATPTPAKPAPAKPSEVAQPEPDPLPELVCWEFGNYPGESQANTAAGALPLGLERVDVVKGEALKVTGYYVLIPAADNLKTAEDTLARLKENQIRDTWLFRSGPLKNAVSLGLFSQRNNAERLADKVRKRGFEVILKEKGTKKEVYRLQVRGRDTAVNARAVKKLSLAEPQRIPCP